MSQLETETVLVHNLPLSITGRGLYPFMVVVKEVPPKPEAPKKPKVKKTKSSNGLVWS